MGIKLKSVQCITPATGIERAGVIFGASLVTVFETAAAGLGIAAAVPEPASPMFGVIAGASAGLGLFTGAVTGIVSEVDSNRSPDQLYITINGKKVWPTGKYQELKSLDIVHPDIDIPLILGPDISGGAFNFHKLMLKPYIKQATIQLWEHDYGSGDDALGFLLVREGDRPIGIHTVGIGNPKEDSLYLLEIEVTGS